LSAWSGIFSPRLSERFNALSDPRNAALTDYSTASLLWTGILMFVCRLGARRQIQHVLNTPNAVSYLRELSGQDDLKRVPHGDTLKNLLLELPEGEPRDLATALVGSLIEKRRLEFARLPGGYYTVALDATGWLVLGYAPSRFTQGCLRRKLSNGKTLYHRPVLEAKLVTPTGLVLSVETEFTENPPRPGQSEEEYKQDCEHSGAKRLLPRLRKRFPRLPICLLLDSLYADGPIFDLCLELDLRFITVLKEGSIPSVYNEFYALIPHKPENPKTVYAKNVVQVIRWINGIDYRGRKVNVLECVETDRTTGKVTTWLWVTDIPITPDNCVGLAQSGGRQRWRIENEGYNVQKNGGYRMEHAYAQAPRTAKNFYLLLQIAHTLAQLFECRTGGKKQVTRRFGSLKNLAALLLECFRTQPMLRGSRRERFMNTRIQARLNRAPDWPPARL